MTENFLHFLSPKNCMLAINGKNIGIIDNRNTFEADVIMKTDRIFVTYNPISNTNNLLPYTFELNNTLNNAENEYIKIVPYPNNHFDIIMKPFYYYSIENSKVILNQNIGNYYVSIVADSHSRINIYSGASNVFSLTTVPLINAKAQLKKELIIIEGIVDSETYYLLVISSKDFAVLHNDIAHSIEECEEYIQTLKNLRDISHHSLVCKITFENKVHEKYYVYENNNAHEPHSPLLTPRVFLECIQSRDENGIKKYMSDKYSNTPIDKFVRYFGNIQGIYLNRHSILQDKINYTIFSDRYKNYNFIMNNNKITDIEEVF